MLFIYGVIKHGTIWYEIIKCSLYGGKRGGGGAGEVRESRTVVIVFKVGR